MGKWALILAVLVTGCSAIPSLTPVGVNGQIGSTNTQTVGVTNVNKPTVKAETVVDPDLSVNQVKGESVVINKTEPWVIILLVLGWLAPSPQEIGRGIGNLFRRRKDA